MIAHPNGPNPLTALERLKPTADAVHNLLRPEGFKRRRNSWNRRDGSFVDALDLQISKSWTDFTVNVGVAYARAIEVVWEKPLGKFIPVAACTVETRAGRLVDGREAWWEVDDPTAAIEVVALVRQYVLEFFERMHSLETLAGMLADPDDWIFGGALANRYPPPRLYLAVIYRDLDRPEDACKVLRTFSSGNAWDDRIGNVARKLGCDWPDDD